MENLLNSSILAVMNVDFLINDRFEVHPGMSQVYDRERRIRQRLEPRVMQILCLMADRSGQLVSRDEMAADIWNDYPGADDALHQAVSILRKALNDTDKILIETVPKKGYVFHGKVAMHAPVSESVGTPKSAMRLKLLFSGIVLLIAAGTIWYVVSSDETTASTETNYQQLPDANVENASNTVTTTGPDGTRYKLVAIGDMRPRFYVNDSLVVADSVREKYASLMGRMQQTLWERQGRTGN
jgi:DNA-binding winged helix-turn-helix (wHTH) protein